MKRLTHSIWTALFLSSLAVLASPGASPEGEVDASLKARLVAIPKGEMIAESAAIVTQSSRDEQERVAVEVVNAVGQLDPAAVAPVVGAISSKVPATAAAVAAAASRLQPGGARLFARAAAVGAPGYAAQIVGTVCGAVPDQFREVTIAVARVVPQASHSILFALGEALPDLRPYLEGAKTQVSEGRADLPWIGLVVAQAQDLRAIAQADVGKKAVEPPPKVGRQPELKKAPSKDPEEPTDQAKPLGQPKETK